MAGASLPPGFRFHPTDEELVGYYLKRKTDGLEIELEVIPVIDLYKFDPWELPEKSFLPKRDLEWFFFCPRDKKYPNGSRTNRATNAGYWKATGKDKKVVCHDPAIVGYRKTLVFYRGRAPLGDRTDWVMHEYRICDDVSQGTPNFVGPYALCRVIKRNEASQKTTKNVQRGTTSKQVGSSSISGSGGFSFSSANDPIAVVCDDTPTQTTYMSNYSTPITSPHNTTLLGEYELSPNMILDSSMECPQEPNLTSYCPQYDFPQWQPNEFASFPNFRGEVEHLSSTSIHGSYMGFYGNEDMTYEGYDHNNSF